MITLCMDTSSKFLVLALIENDRLIGSRCLSSWKRQSEMIFPQLTELLEECALTPKAISEVVVTKGPGSYTGVRIAMTVAKVLCSTAHLPLYALPTLELIGAGKEKAAVLLDARSQRAYFGMIEHGRLTGREEVLPVSEIQARIEEADDVELVGDCSLLGLADCYPDLAKAFLIARPQWQKVENVHLLVPEYLKSADDYLVKSMIREMTLDDLEIVCEMEQRLFSSPWPRESYEYELKENPYSHLFVALNDAGVLVGYAGVWTTFDQAQITTIGVDLPYRRQHWATQLMDHMLRCAEDNGCEMISLEVRVSNVPALTCYKKYGFEIINIRKGYYQDNHEDAYLMMKPIGGNV